jgi:hypothetical protein
MPISSRKKSRKNAQPIRTHVVVDVNGRNPLGDDLKLEAPCRLVIGKPEVGSQDEGNEAEPHGQILDGPLLIFRDEQDQHNRQQRGKGDKGEQ